MRSKPSKSISFSSLIVAGAAFTAAPAFAANPATSGVIPSYDYTVTLALVLAGVIALIVVAIVVSAFQNRGNSARERRKAEMMHQAGQPFAGTSAPQAARVRARAMGETTNVHAKERSPMVTLPSQLPESYEERDRLIKQMVEAGPDRANPFISPRARLRRARLILQSIGHTFEHGEAWIDLSDYPEIWPELSRDSASRRPPSEAKSPHARNEILEPA